MSHIIYDQWLETAKENFDQAVEEGNLPAVKDIIADVFEVSPESARYLNEVVRNLPVSTWKIISPIQKEDI